MTERPNEQQDERPDVTDAMATYAAKGQSDDETGGDAAAAADYDPASPNEDDREPHGPA